MRRFLVELYVPRSPDDGTASARRAREAVEQLAREGTAVRYVRTTLLPDDETCFHVFEAPSPEVVAQVTQRAGFAGARILRAIE
jgi:hypothetical protein